MRKVILRMNEQEKYDIIKNLVAKNGSKLVASTKLNCSVRHINRLIIKLKTKGKQAFIHGNRNLKPSTTINDEIKNTIINLYQSQQYNNANFNHFKELLLENKNIKVSYNFIHNLLSKNNILLPKYQRITKKIKAKLEREQQKRINIKPTITKEIEVLTNIKASRKIPNSLVHPRKPRSKYFGQQIQMDASDHL